MKIAVLIPCLNEEKTVAKVVQDFRAEFPKAKIYVYDNNSSDKTAELAKKTGAIVRSVKKRGKGNVIRAMFREIEADCYIMVDSDDTYFSDDAKKMISLVVDKNYDMVVGDRLSTTYYTENKRRFHSFGNRFIKFLIQKLFHTKTNDILTGYRAFSKNFVRNFSPISNGFEIETEMTIFAAKNKIKVKEVPISYQNRPAGSESKLKTIKDGLKILFMTMKLFFKK